MISAPDTNLNHAEFDWNSGDSVLMPIECIVTLPENTAFCGCKKKCTGRCQCSKFGALCTEFCKCNREVFSEPNFPIYGQNPRTCTGKCVSEKTRICAHFTQCDVFHLLAQKRTHY